MPAHNHGTFTIQSTKGGVFELIDVIGKVINTYTIISTQQTDHENMPGGMYFVRERYQLC
jgi:rRNA processing protein Gar1